jgi:hypothetical protein
VRSEFSVFVLERLPRLCAQIISTLSLIVVIFRGAKDLLILRMLG